MNNPSLILASESPRRAELLRQLGLQFKVVASNASEIQHEQLTAREVAQLSAYAIQEEGDLLVDRVAGSYTNVVGLPIEKLRVQLGEFPGFNESMAGLSPLVAAGKSGHGASRSAQFLP